MPYPLPYSRRTVRAGASLIAAALLAAGCASERGMHRRGPDGDAAAAAAAIPEMEANAMFFAGQVEVEVLLNRAGFAPRDGKVEASSSGERRGGGGGLRGGFGGGGRYGMRGGGGEAGGFRGGEGSRETQAPHIVASNQPPVALHLRLTNHTSAPLDVEVPDFNSDLGNFVVQPVKMTIPPNGSADADPMTSRLGVAATDIPLTVALRMSGQTETQGLTLHVKAPTPSAPTSPPPDSH